MTDNESYPTVAQIADAVEKEGCDHQGVPDARLGETLNLDTHDGGADDSENRGKRCLRVHRKTTQVEVEEQTSLHTWKADMRKAGRAQWLAVEMQAQRERVRQSMKYADRVHEGGTRKDQLRNKKSGKMGIRGSEGTGRRERERKGEKRRKNELKVLRFCMKANRSCYHRKRKY